MSLPIADITRAIYNLEDSDVDLDVGKPLSQVLAADVKRALVAGTRYGRAGHSLRSSKW